MTTKVYLSTLDEVVEREQACVSVFDRGFLYGDSVYETVRTAGGHPVEFERHVRRLHRSAAGIGLVIAFSDDDLARAVAETHAATGNVDSRVRIIVTRGPGPWMLDPTGASDPLFVVIVEHLVLPDAQVYRAGISAITVEVDKTGGGLVDPGLKTGNYLNSVLAVQHAVRHGADDAILCGPTGQVTEGATSNVFAVVDGAVVTPPLEAGLLAGITREVVCELAAAAGVALEERPVTRAELRGAEEVFLTSSVRGIMPVSRLDGMPVGAGAIGPVTEQLLARYEDYLGDWARGIRSP